MLDPGLLELKGAQADTRFISLATIKFVAGLMTQRSPFSPIDTRYGTRAMGGKPDAFISGSNCEISNKLVLQRRPGLAAYGVSSIPPPLAFFAWQATSPSSLSLLIDTATAVYRYSPTFAGIHFNKAALAGQANFHNLVNTVYIGDGVDLYKIIGPNLLAQSNTFTNAVWAKANAPLTPGQTDPNGGSAATRVSWAISGVLANIQQTVTPNVTPVPDNTFTFSLWMKRAAGAESVKLELIDQVNTVVASSVFALTTSWARYEITGTMTSGSSTSGANTITVRLSEPTATDPIDIYGAQLEVGGPALPTNITTTKPQGVYNWGIVAPVTAATLAFAQVGTLWQATFNYAVGNQITDSNGNKQTVTVDAGSSGATQPVWATTQNSTTVDGGITWRNDGPNGLSPKTGYQYFYAFFNSQTGHLSSVSPVSATTGALIGQQITVSGARSTDVQVDRVMIFRNTDGGAFFFKLTEVDNPPSGTWSFADTTQDTGLNTSIYAPIGSLNIPPPAGALDPVFHASRLWVHAGSTLYYAASADNAALLNVLQNGVSAESWPILNSIPFDAPIIRKAPTSAGLLVFTTSDIWIVLGKDLTEFFALKLFQGHGLRSYNALDTDGATITAYLADRQLIGLNPNTGAWEVGFSVGDLLESTFDPTLVYVSRHVGGSQDNATFIGDGSTGWLRVNPNQVGASISGEQEPLWSPRATVAAGVKAIASIETAPGIRKLLVGKTSTGPVLVRDLTAFSDNGATYAWDAVIGSIILAESGTLAEVESITVDATSVAVPAVGVLLDEISGAFETLSNSVNDPPQLATSATLSSRRYYLSQGAVPPLCKHMQIKLSGGAAATKDEVLAITIRGALVAEQN